MRHPLVCGIYRTEAPGLEVRAGFSDEDVIRAQRVIEIGSVREASDTWKAVALVRDDAALRPMATHPQRLIDQTDALALGRDLRPAAAEGAQRLARRLKYAV